MPRRSSSSEQWGRAKRTVSGVPAKRYAFLISPSVQVPNLRVDNRIWERIARGVPRDYVLPDAAMLEELKRLIKAQKLAEPKKQEE